MARYKKQNRVGEGRFAGRIPLELRQRAEDRARTQGKTFTAWLRGLIEAELQDATPPATPTPAPPVAGGPRCDLCGWRPGKSHAGYDDRYADDRYADDHHDPAVCPSCAGALAEMG